MEWNYDTGKDEAFMKRFLSSFLIFLIIGLFSPVACAPADLGLSGAAGEGEGEEQPGEEESGGGNPIDEPTEGPPSDYINEYENPPEEEVPPPAVVNFLLPTLTIFISGDGTSYTTGISTPPMGTAEYQLTAPSKMLERREHLVKLILVPNQLPVDKNEVFEDFEKDSTQAFQGEIDYFSQMNAEIITGTAFSVQPSKFLHKYINEEKSTTWLWYITGLQVGTHNISIVISTPVIVNNAKENFELENIEFEVDVYSPQQTDTPAAINSADSNAGASDTNITVGTGFTVTVEALTAVMALITAIVGIGSVYNKIRKLILKNLSQSKDKAIGAVRVKDAEKKNSKSKK